MARINGYLASMIAGSTVLGLTFQAGAVDASMVIPQGTSACLVGLGSGDGDPAWSQLDVTPNRSVDLDLANGAGLTVACGTFGSTGHRPATIVAPTDNVDPSRKGDFGSL